VWDTEGEKKREREILLFLIYFLNVQNSDSLTIAFFPLVEFFFLIEVGQKYYLIEEVSICQFTIVCSIRYTHTLYENMINNKFETIKGSQRII